MQTIKISTQEPGFKKIKLRDRVNKSKTHVERCKIQKIFLCAIILYLYSKDFFMYVVKLFSLKRAALINNL